MEEWPIHPGKRRLARGWRGKNFLHTLRPAATIDRFLSQEVQDAKPLSDGIDNYSENGHYVGGSLDRRRGGGSFMKVGFQ